MHTLTSMTYLIVEDDEPKLNAIHATLLELDETAEILSAGSVASAVNIISNFQIDFAILDMSLPAFDIANDIAGGGQPQGFGGRDVLRFLEDSQSGAIAVILTQYEEFNISKSYASSQTLYSMTSELKDEFGDLLIDVIYYAGQRGAWRDQLKKIIKPISEKNK